MDPEARRPAPIIATVTSTLTILAVLPPFLAVLIQVLGATGVGLAGPDQTWTIQQGQGLSSYLIVYNQGDSQKPFQAAVTGNASSLVSVSPASFNLAPGGSRRITLTYSVPVGQATGLYTGVVRVWASGDGVSPSASKDVAVSVVAPGQQSIQLGSGLNLVAWTGPTGSFTQVLPDRKGVFKVWRRNPDGTYASAQYYPANGVWWSSDSSFNGLETGRAYFFESDAACTLQPSAGTPPASLHLVQGLNLVGWSHPTRPVQDIFMQSPADYAVNKVWRRLGDGSYSFLQYYPSSDAWWSSDSSFTALEQGRAYFIEAVKEADISP